MTKLEYLENTYLFESIAKIIDYGENEFGRYLVLDKTIFYPQGGGQPNDIGKIFIGETIFDIKNVRINEKGIVFHYGDFLSEISLEKLVDTKVKLNIDKKDRIINSKNHTGGHLLDIAMNNIGVKIIPTKGFHFKQGCYIEYSGILEIDKAKIIEKLNTELKILISKNIKIKVESGDKSINNTKSPEGKSFRFVYFEGYKKLGCGCGGTHIKNTLEIGDIRIRKIKEKKGITKISYEVF